MTDFLVVYHGATDEQQSQEQKMARMEAWMKWMGSIGSAIKDAGHPASRAWTVTKDGTTEDAGSNPATGYSIVTADSMQAALDMVVGCPQLAEGGNIELCELTSAGHASVR